MSRTILLLIVKTVLFIW